MPRLVVTSPFAELGPSEDQAQVLRRFGYDPEKFAKTSRPKITNLVHGLVEQAKRKTSKGIAAATTKERYKKIKELGLEPGMRVLIKVSPYQHTEAVIEMVTRDGRIGLLGWERRFSPSAIRPLPPQSSQGPTHNDSS